MTITKEQFEVAYNRHLPSKWVSFAFKYFSKETVKKDMALTNILTFLLLGLFGVGFISVALGLSKVIIAASTIGYTSLLALFVLYLFSAVELNNKRITKICKELDITKFQYNELVKEFYK